jgi:hypothetical protein
VLPLFLHTTTSNRWITWEFDHLTVEPLRISPHTGEALGIGDAPRGMMKGYVLSLFDCQPAD